MIVGFVYILQVLTSLSRFTRGTPCRSTSATWFLSYGKSHALIEGATIESHLTRIATARYSYMAHVNLCNLRAKLLQTIEDTAEPPCPLTIGTIILQLRIETVETMFSPVVMRSPLSVVVYLFLVEVHDSNGTIRKDLSWQNQHTGTYHQRIRSLARLRIGDSRFQPQRTTIHRHIHEESVSHHTGHHSTIWNSRLRANAVMLNLMSYLTTTVRPLSECLYLTLSVAPLERIRQFPAFLQIIEGRHLWSLELCTSILYGIYLRHSLRQRLCACH